MTYGGAASVLRSDWEASGADVVRFQARAGNEGVRMLTWSDANRIANIASAQAHARLSVDLSGTRVDVIEALRTAGIEVMWQPMPRLFGALIDEPGGAPGVLINSGLPRAARRHTAAHELGHWYLAHSTSVDDGSTIDTVFGDQIDSIPPGSRRRSWPDQEKAAESFAAWFLMPRRVVASALTVLGIARPSTAGDVYQLALLLGTSYRTTLRHLPNLRLATTRDCSAWASVAPGTLKARLDAGVEPPMTRVPDVWHLNRRYGGLDIRVGIGDRLVLPAGSVVLSGLPDWLRSVPAVTAHAPSAVLEVLATDTRCSQDVVVEDPAFTVAIHAEPRPLGLDPRRS